MSNLQVNMTKDPIVKSLVIFALPILFSNIFQHLYNTIDIMIVGNFLGDSSLAAIGASSSIYELLLGFCFGVGNGLSIVVSRYFGQGDKTLLKKSVAGSIIIALILTAILMTASSLGLYPLMRALKTPENLLAESHSYVSTLTTFIGVMFAYNLLAGLLRGIGNSFMPLVFLIISSLSFMGMGIQPPQPEWGTMLYEGRDLIRTSPYLVIFPGIAIALAVLSLNLLGDGLRDALDPRMKN